MADLQKGEVITKTSNHGKKVLSAEMLLAPQASLKLTYNEDCEYVTMTIADTTLEIPEMSGEIDVDTLEDYIKALKLMYMQLKNF